MLFKGLVLLVIAAVSIAVSVLDPETLVIYDPKITTLESVSNFIDSLKERSFDITFKEVGEPISLFKNSERAYSNVIIFPTKLRTIGEEINGAKLLEFFNEGGNVFTITNPDGLSESVRTFVNQLGIFPSPRNNQLIDHFGYNPDLAKDTHDVLRLSSSNIIDEQAIITSKPEGVFNYKGSSALLGNGRLLFPILQAPSTSYTKDLKSDDPLLDNSWTVGTQGYLSVAFQGLNNARAVWIGTDSYFQDTNPENSEFTNQLINELSKWCFHESKVIKTTSVEHKHVDGTSYEERPYKIKDDIIYKIGISEWDGDAQEWIPYVADDVQLEIKLLDPYHRLTLNSLGTEDKSTIFGTEFKLPDHHGVFTFTTNYRRPGLSYIDESHTMAIRHLANDEYPRSWEIPNSWVYVTSAVVVFIGWFIFTVVFIYSGETTVESKKEK